MAAAQVIPLTFDMILVLSILVFTMVLSLANVIRVDIVAVLVLVVLGLTRLLPPEQLFSGFSSEAAISLIAVMIIGAGLEKSGIALRVARWILKIGREKTEKISTALMITSGVLSSFMRSLGTVALLLPVVSRITARTGISKARLLMPMAFCSIIGGTLTMVGSGPLILLNSVLKNADEFVHHKKIIIEPFQLFSVLPLGVILLVMGVIYCSFLSKKHLANEPRRLSEMGTLKSQFLKTYGKGGDIFELQVPISSKLVNMTVSDFELNLDPICSLLAVMIGQDLHFPPLRRVIIEANAQIAIMGTKEKVTAFAEKFGLKLLPRLNVFSEVLHPVRAGLAEAVIPPSSKLIGSEARELHMRRTHQLHVLALLRGQTVYQGEALKELTLRPGDTFGMFCRWEALADFHKNPDFVVLTTMYPKEEIRPHKVWFALLFFLLAIALIVFGGFSVSVGLLLGAVGMIASGVLTVDEAYETVSWKSVFLLAGLIPLGLVMQTTHTTDWLTQHAPILQEDLPIWVLETLLAILSTVLTFAISGVGATVVLVPVAIDLAVNVGADPRIFALIVAVSASNTFLAPMHQANALIAGPGNYQIKDFLKMGSGLTLLYWIVMLIGIRLFY